MKATYPLQSLGKCHVILMGRDADGRMASLQVEGNWAAQAMKLGETLRFPLMTIDDDPLDTAAAARSRLAALPRYVPRCVLMAIVVDVETGKVEPDCQPGAHSGGLVGFISSQRLIAEMAEGRTDQAA